MFTAIILDNASAAHLRLVADANCFLSGATMKLHHCTLAMGDASDRFKVGEERTLTVTHTGEIRGRVCAFKVDGASDSDNRTPHITIATFGEGKAKESNQIRTWIALDHPLTVRGRVTVCQ